MVRIGYTLSSEEFGPLELVANAEFAENAGFSFLMISDHFHPWVDAQGESPFVWNVLGALSQVVKTANVGIGVNAPIIRYHPAVVAQAAATTQVMFEGRFMLGVGTGENLNEHVVGQGWPPYEVRKEMLREAIAIMKLLWEGGYQDYYGSYYTVDSARIYTLPKNTIPIIYSAYGQKSATEAGELGDAFISTSPKKELVKIFEEHGGKGKPKYAQVNVCYHHDKEKAKEMVKKVWPLSGIPSPLNSELKIPAHFENVRKIVSIEEATKNIPIGADVEGILKLIKTFEKAGFTEIYIHNIGPFQKEFISFFAKMVLPEISN